jgi:upstream activation factor subunit UAF30
MESMTGSGATGGRRRICICQPPSLTPMDVKKLVPKIRAVLTAPGVDLSQISAKGVRKQLQSEDPSLDPEWIKEHKTEIDALILEVFDAVNSGKGYSNGEADDGEDDADTPGGSGSSEADGSKGVKRKRSESPTIPPSSVLPPSQLPMAKVSKAAAHSITDAKLARQISAELNSRPTRGSSSQVNRKKLVNGRSGSSKKSKVKKSPSKIVDSDGDEDEEDEDDEAHSSKKVKKRGGGGFQKEFILR